MKRIHLSLVLGLSALLAAIAAPSLQASVARTEPAHPEPEAEPRITAADPSSGALAIRAAVDHRELRRGGEEERYLVVEVEGLALPELPRQAVDLALVIDESGSMAGEPIQQAREAAAAIAEALGPEDRLAVVGFSSQVRTVLPLTRPTWAAQALDGLRASGNTAMYAGFWSGCNTVKQGSGQAQVIVLSDGVATLGPDRPWDFASAAESCAAAGVTTSAVGLGTGFEVESLSAMVDAGGGSWLYASEPSEIAEAFLEQLERSRSSAGRGVTLDLELAEGVELLDVYGYESWDGQATAEGYRAFLGDIPAGTTRKVVARVRVDGSASGVEELAHASLRWQDPLSEGELHRELGLPVEWTWSGASADASTVAWTAEHVLDARTGRALEASLQLKQQGRADEADETLALALKSLGSLASAYGSEVGERGAVLEETRISFDELSGEAALDHRTRSSLEALGYLE